MAAESVLQVGRHAESYLVRVVGRGTMQESTALASFLSECLRNAAKFITVDLTACQYLDSTFMGCLLGVHKTCEQNSVRLTLIASPETRQQLFCSTHLEQVFNFDSQCPAWEGELLALQPGDVQMEELGQHVMQCHRRLAELGGPDAKNFQAIADRLAQELDGQS